MPRKILRSITQAIEPGHFSAAGLQFQSEMELMISKEKWLAILMDRCYKNSIYRFILQIFKTVQTLAVIF